MEELRKAEDPAPQDELQAAATTSNGPSSDVQVAKPKKEIGKWQTEMSLKWKSLSKEEQDRYNAEATKQADVSIDDVYTYVLA